MDGFSFVVVVRVVPVGGCCKTYRYMAVVGLRFVMMDMNKNELVINNIDRVTRPARAIRRRTRVRCLDTNYCFQSPQKNAFLAKSYCRSDVLLSFKTCDSLINSSGGVESEQHTPRERSTAHSFET